MSIEKQIANIPNLSKADRDQVRKNAEQLLAKGAPDRQEDARRMLAALVAHEAEEARGGDVLLGDLTALQVRERVVHAFTMLPMTETDRMVVQALLDNPDANSDELSAAIGWKGGWHMHFGAMCRDRAVYLWRPPYSERREADFYSGILSDWSWATGQLTYTMRPEVAAALVSLGLRPPKPA